MVFFLYLGVVLFMSVKWKTTINKIPELIATTETISGRKVQVGAASSDAWL